MVPSLSIAGEESLRARSFTDHFFSSDCGSAQQHRATVSRTPSRAPREQKVPNPGWPAGCVGTKSAIERLNALVTNWPDRRLILNPNIKASVAMAGGFCNSAAAALHAEDRIDE